MLDSLAIGLKECRGRRSLQGGPQGGLQLDGFLDGMLRSRISRRIIAEQHIHLARPRPLHIGVIHTNLYVM